MGSVEFTSEYTCVSGSLTTSFLCVCLHTPLSSILSLHVQKRKSSSLLDARMAKIYRRQRHSRDGDDSASDDDDEGLSVFKTVS